jgi:tripartite-type tricarboxylate transporter receptor subunit TctC
MTKFRHALFATVGLALLVVSFGGIAHGQPTDFPNRKISIIVGFAPGGGVDVLARVIAQGLAEQFGYQIVIENRPGAASNIAAKVVASADPDGYTLLFTGNSFAVNQTLYKHLNYATDELRPVAFATRDSQALAVSVKSPIQTLAQLLDVARKQPVNVGIGGSSSRIVAEYVLQIMAKTQAISVPFQSGTPAMNGLLGGHVDVVAGPVSEIVAQIQQGAVRALAVTGPRRAQSLPDVPTLSESGFPGLEITGWIGMLAPAKTPTEICAKLNAAINAVVVTPGVDARLRQLGYEPFTVPIAEAPEFLKDSIDSWGKMIRATGITAE